MLLDRCVRRKGDRGSCVSTNRFEDDLRVNTLTVRAVQRPQLLCNQKPVLLIAHDDGRLQTSQSAYAKQR
jgi:hypothetical protein